MAKWQRDFWGRPIRPPTKRVQELQDRETLGYLMALDDAYDLAPDSPSAPITLTDSQTHLIVQAARRLSPAGYVTACQQRPITMLIVTAAQAQLAPENATVRRLDAGLRRQWAQRQPAAVLHHAHLDVTAQYVAAAA